jgi:hypothetical protein
VEAPTKTDAAVLFDLIGEMQKGLPSNEQPAYVMLAQFNERNGGSFDVIALVYACCGRLRQFVEMIPNTTAVHKKSFLSAITTFENNFALKNMGLAWKTFLANIQNPVHVQALHFLDYMVQSQPFWRTRSIDVQDVEELLNQLAQVIEQTNLPDYLKSIVLNDIEKLRVIIKNYNRFGEQDYWEKFQKLTGLFGSIYTTLDEKAREQAQPVLAKMIRRITTGVSISADLATLATTAFVLLPRA